MERKGREGATRYLGGRLSVVGISFRNRDAQSRRILE
jgi:hypothetical protein